MQPFYIIRKEEIKKIKNKHKCQEVKTFCLFFWEKTHFPFNKILQLYAYYN